MDYSTTIEEQAPYSNDSAHQPERNNHFGTFRNVYPQYLKRLRCGLPLWLCRSFCCCVGVLAFIAIGIGIAAPLTSRKLVVGVPPLGYAQNSQSKYNQSVIIVGAGAAGMFAAYSLEYMGVNYTILEAEDQFGGRTLQKDDFVSVPLDLGAEWCHVHPRILNDLLLFDKNGKDLPEMIDYRLDTITIYRKNRDKVKKRNWISWFYADTKFKNTTWWSYFDDFIVPHIADNLRLSTPVNLIDYIDPDIVRVVTTSGEVYTANQVILATSVAMFQTGIIYFQPELPDWKAAAFNKVEVAPGLKAWIEFSEDFYPDMAIWGSLLDYARIDKLYFDALFGKGISDHNVCALFEVGPTVGDKVYADDETIITAMLAELDAMFDGKASKYYVQSFVQNWSQKPYQLGAYSYNWHQVYKSRGELIAPIDGRLYFCGEYTAEESATVHGAAISGRFAAKQIIDDHGIPPAAD